MNEFLEKAMLFINENTMLLIGICIFLILVLIGYLIDNAIKTRKLEKEELLKANEGSIAEEVKNAAPVIEKTIEEVKPEIEIEKSPENLKAEIVTEPIVEEPKQEVTPVMPEVPVTNVVETPVVEETPSPVVETPIVEETPSPVVETSSMEELLNKDFSKNNEIVNNLKEEDLNVPITNEVKIETEVIEEPKQEVTPVIPEVPVTKVEEEKSPYKSDKKISDIFSKKKEEPKLETTQDFSDELDRILSKLNEETKEVNTSLDTEEEINNRF